MNALNLTSNLVPRTHPSNLPPMMLDNLQLALPIVVENVTGLTTKFSLPESLKHICEGRNLYIGSLGNVVIGKDNLNCNGTKLLYGEIGKPYQTRSKNQNFLCEEDIPLIKKFLNVQPENSLPADLYRCQLKILSDRLEEIRYFLLKQGHKSYWRPERWNRLNRLKRLEICQDFLAPVDPSQLIRKLDGVVSAVEGEPRRSAQERSKKFSRQVPFHYWDVKPADPCLRIGTYNIKLYQKDRFVRLELACTNVQIQNMPDGTEPFSWLQGQMLAIAAAAANYLCSITKELLATEPKINNLDRVTLIEGLKLYSVTLKYTDEAVRIFVDSIMNRQVYTPTAHRGQKVGRKSLENLSEPNYGICIKTLNGAYSPVTFALRKDWQEQIERKKLSKVKADENPPIHASPETQKTSPHFSRREFIFGRKINEFKE